MAGGKCHGNIKNVEIVTEKIQKMVKKNNKNLKKIMKNLTIKTQKNG